MTKDILASTLVDEKKDDIDQTAEEEKLSLTEAADLPPALLASLNAAIRVSKSNINDTEAPEEEPNSDTSPVEISPENDDRSEPDDVSSSDESAINNADDPVEARDELDDEEEDDEDEEYEDDEDDEEDDEEEENDDPEISGKMSLKDHLRELRKRVVRAFLCMVLGFLVCYPFAEEIYLFLMQPLMQVMPPNSTMIFTAVPEAFFTYLKLAFLAGMFLVSPLIFYQIWAFVAPGLYKEEKRFIIPIAILSGICFVGGAAFCFFMVFPIAFEFFMGYNTGNIQAMPSVREYLSFVLHLTFAFGLVFELPLFVFFLARIGVVTAATMRRFRRYSIVIVFIIAALLTPPDPLSQLMMAGPMLLLYEFSILLAAIFGKKSAVTEEKDADKSDDESDDEDTTGNENGEPGENGDIASKP